MSSGRGAEREAKAIYEDSGCRVYHPPKAKYREQDVFGLFDLLAYTGDGIEAVQVKSGRDAAGIEAWFEAARVFEDTVDGLQLAFLHRADTAWRYAVSTDSGYTWEFDGRDDRRPLELVLPSRSDS